MSMTMKFDYARKFIQEVVKEALNVTSIPKQASKPALVKRLIDMGLTEPYDREHCKQIADAIVAEVLKEQSAITPVSVQDDAMVEAGGDNQPIDWQEELTGELSVKEPLPKSDEDTTQPPTNITASSQLVFQNNFEKAALVKSSLELSNIVVSDTQAIDIAAKMPNTFENRRNFYIDVLEKYQRILTINQEIESDTLTNYGMSIVAQTMKHENNKRETLNRIFSQVAATRQQFDQDFEKAIIDLMNQ